MFWEGKWSQKSQKMDSGRNQVVWNRPAKFHRDPSGLGKSDISGRWFHRNRITWTCIAKMDMLYMVMLGKDWKWKSKKSLFDQCLGICSFFPTPLVFFRLNQSQTLCQVLCLEDGALENDKASRTWDIIGTSWDAQKKVPWQYPNVQ